MLTVAPAQPTTIDLASLSQSDLLSLSAATAPAAAPDEFVIPAIDRSVFNESAGSRRQTYSRPPTSTSPSVTSPVAASGHHRNRVPALKPHQPPSSSSQDPLTADHASIIAHLKYLLSQNPNFTDVILSRPCVAIPESWGSSGFPRGREEIGGVLGFKRKRGRKPRSRPGDHVSEYYSVRESQTVLEIEIVNRDGNVVDVNELEKEEDPFGGELRSRTSGMASEEELLGFLKDLGGQWGSRRRRRKIVDASGLGNKLPRGWRLLLAIKRKGGHAWVYVRRYISPTGEQFLSCKEISSYLRDYFGQDKLSQLTVRKIEHVSPETTPAVVTYKGENISHVVHRSSLSSTPAQVEDKKEVNLSGVENLPDVMIQDLFQCPKCSMTFDEKDGYLRHLVSFHQRSTRKHRLGSAVGEGVIMKDGKFECQFCHKVFDERRRYNGHVGNHVKNYVRRGGEAIGQGNVQDDSDAFSGEASSLRKSRMDALIDIAQNSIQSNSSKEGHGKSHVALPRAEMAENCEETVPKSRMNVVSSVVEQSVKNSPIKETTESNTENPIPDAEEKIDERNLMVDVNVGGSLNPAESMVVEQNDDVLGNSGGKDGKVVEHDGSVDNANVLEGKVLERCPGSPTDKNEQNDISAPVGDLEHHDIYEKDVLFVPESSRNEVSYRVYKTMQEIFENSAEEDAGPDPVAKGEDDFSSVDQRNDDLDAIEELRYGDDETQGFGFVAIEESVPLGGAQIGLLGNNDADLGNVASVQFESEDVVPDTGVNPGCQLTTACVWCGVEFTHDAPDSELQSDSVGFMCSTCKAKISGQINLLDSGSPSNTHYI